MQFKMSLQSNASRDFNKHMSMALNQLVKVELDIDNRYYIGRLVGVDAQTNALVLEDAKDEKNNKVSKVFVSAKVWLTINVLGEPFPMEKLLERIKKIMPGEEIILGADGVISLLGGKITVSEKGVQGKGPTFDRIQKLFDIFVGEMK